MDGFGNGIMEWLESHPGDSFRISRRPHLESIDRNRPIFALTLIRDDGLHACYLFRLEELKAMSSENVLDILNGVIYDTEEEPECL